MGLVEARVNDSWIQICVDHEWDDADANVLCTSLGFKKGSAVHANYFPGPPPPTPPLPPVDFEEGQLLTRVLTPGTIPPPPPKLEMRFFCQGKESGLESCNGKWIDYCYRDAAAVCVGPSVSGGLLYDF